MSKKQKEFIIMDVLILSYGDSYHIENSPLISVQINGLVSI